MRLHRQLDFLHHRNSHLGYARLLWTASAQASGNITVDAAGDVWTCSFSDRVIGSSGVGAVTETVGISAPTITPVALALKNHTIGTRP